MLDADRREERKGPRVGAPEAAVQGFLKSAGLKTLDQVQMVSDGKKGEIYVAIVEKKGRATAWAPMAVRRAQRPRKLCAFHPKNPTGRTAVRLSRLPSTRQKIGSPWAKRFRLAGAMAADGDLICLDVDIAE